jgi:hypothetical protein
MRNRRKSMERVSWVRKLMLAVIAATLTAAVLGAALSASTAGGRHRKNIAVSRAYNFRVVVTAVKGSGGGDAPPATVGIKAFQRSREGWQRLGSLRVGRRNGFFWKVVRKPGSIRGFTVTNGDARRTSLRLRISPSIGWSKVFRFRVENGELVRA